MSGKDSGENRKRVIHKTFGEGVVTEIRDNRVGVVFDRTGEKKVFPYPKIFEQFLSFVDEGMQAEVSNQVHELLRKENEAIEKRNAEYAEQEKARRKERMALMKKKREAKNAAHIAAAREKKKIEEIVQMKMAQKNQP